MTRRHFIKLASIMLVLVCMFSFTIPAYAASGVKNDPYGYTYVDDDSGIWYFQYYKSPKNNGVYTAVDVAYLNGNTLYDMNSKVIAKNVRGMSNNPSLDTTPTVAFYNGNLYFLTTTGELCKMTTSTATTYSKSKTAPSAKTFTLDADGLGYKVGSTKLSSMSFSGTYNRGSSSSSGNNSGTNNKTGNYVKTYTSPNDPLRVCYDAYRDDEVIISVACKNANVWLETEQILLSETCVGAKFVGYSHDYFTIMYDQDGSVYAFPYGNYETALPISLGEEIMSYKKDDNGFVESITTSKKTYNLDKLLAEYNYDEYVWINKLDYAVNSTSKSVVYDDDGKALVTLKKSNNYLYFGDTKLSKSYKPTYFGFTDDGYPIWINSDSDLYYYNPVTKVIRNLKLDVTRLRFNDNGFVYQYSIGSKNYAIDF